MSKVFISSIVNNFEEYRQAAKKAVNLLGYTPVMSEDFGARAYSSETACIHEAEQSDIYVLILGEKYGFETEDGISVTQAEFNAAKSANRPILVFIQQGKKEPKQQAFQREVENYQGGFFRASFNSPEELKEEMVIALRQLETMSQAVPESEFNERVNNALKEVDENHHFMDEEPTLALAFLPQPDRMVDIVGIEDRLDDIFQTLSKTGLVKLKDGYKSIEEKHWTGLKTSELIVAYFADGLILLKSNPTITNDSILTGRFAPPDKLVHISNSFLSLINENSGYIHIGLLSMGNTYVAPLPEGSSFSMKIFGDESAGFNRLFAPLTKAAYTEWMGQCVRRFSRIFKYKD